MIGGYQLIPCNGAKLVLDGASVKVAGIYKTLDSKSKKRIVLEDITITDDNGHEIVKGSLNVNVSREDSGLFYLYVYAITSGAYIEVHRDDTIQFVN